MNETICGIKCGNCTYINNCDGCKVTSGSPFGKGCVISNCCKKHDLSDCSECKADFCSLKKQLISEINSMGIPNMPEVHELYALKGSFVNLEFPLPCGEKVKFWDDDKIYLGCQLEKTVDSDSCYGICADERYILVCEYGENGSNPGIVAFIKRKI